jgi:glutamate synthase domain-containing protein 3
MEMVTLEPLTKYDKETVEQLLNNHKRYTGSPPAKKILDNLNKELKRFIKIMPIEYKHILKNVKTEKELDLLEVSDG